MAICVGDLLNGAIRLESDGVSPPQVQSFRCLFERAWGRVPSLHRDVIEQYWRTGLAPMDCRGKPHVKHRYHPKIELYDDTRPDYRGVPEVVLDGHVVLFPIHLLAEMGDDSATLAVAHELAHVSFYASSHANHWPDAKNDHDYSEAERVVDERLLEWGFDRGQLNVLDAWLLERGFHRI